MKHFFFFLLFCEASLLSAQTFSFKEPASTDTVGYSKMVVVYQYVCKTLDENDLPVSDSLLIALQIGDEMWKSFPYGRYQKQQDSKFNPLDCMYLEAMMHVPTIFIDNVNRKIIAREAISATCFESEEKKPNYNWSLSADNANVLDYECQNASCNFHGKEWHVLFSEEIPVSAGPWKLGGLPGLIMKAEDEDGTHSFEAVQIFMEEAPITFEKYYMVKHFTLQGDLVKRYDFVKKSPKQMISLRKSVFGHKNYPNDPMLFVAPGGYSEFRYGDTYDVNIINGVVVPATAHKFQPLEN